MTEKINNCKKQKPSFLIRTFGCQMNEYDSQRIAYYMENAGYISTGQIDLADIIIYNTCSVREKAENRLYGHIGNLKALKKSNPDLLICIAGCTAQNLREKIQEDFPFVDIVLGTHNVPQIVQLINTCKKTGRTICQVDEQGFDYVLGCSIRPQSFRAYVPIITGCNNYCSYCIVPFVRGREKSLDPNSILKNVSNLAKEGVKEITLLGQNVNSYGNDLQQDIDFSKLLEKISEFPIRGIRFMTSHPKDFNPRLVKVIKENDNVLNHIHLPLQSGSDRILGKMNRKYTANKYLSIIDDIKRNIRNCSITTDIIVGFPGEKEKDFLKTLDIVKKVRFKRAFTFIYSPRSGTAAEKIKDEVSREEKNKWFSRLVSVQNRISHEENSKMEGKVFDALAEGISHKNHSLLQARLYDNTIVIIEADKKIIGQMIRVKIKEAKPFYLIGNYIKVI